MGGPGSGRKAGGGMKKSGLDAKHSKVFTRTKGHAEFSASLKSQKAPKLYGNKLKSDKRIAGKAKPKSFFFSGKK